MMNRASSIRSKLILKKTIETELITAVDSQLVSFAQILLPIYLEVYSYELRRRRRSSR